MVKAVIFDCFGVICVGARSYAVSHCPEALRSQLNELFDQADYGFLTTDEFVQQGATILSMNAEDFRAMLDRQYHRDDAMLDLIRRLRGHYKTALLTNANDTIIRRLFSPDELHGLFDETIISSEVGMIKPSAQLFELAATRLDCTPEECVMVDDLAHNIDGAARIGMKGVVFTDRAQCETQLQGFGVYA